MALILGQCDDCIKSIKFEIQQTIFNQKLRWYLSYNCPFCGSSVELDDAGLLPQNIRNEILMQEGEWEIIIKNYDRQKPAIIKCFRQFLGLSTLNAYQ